MKWTDRSSGKCSVLWADGMLYCRNENGPISLVEATPKGFHLKGRFDQPDRSDRNSWPYLVIANGVMYVRDQDVLLAYDVRGENESAISAGTCIFQAFTGSPPRFGNTIARALAGHPHVQRIGTEIHLSDQTSSPPSPILTF